MLFFFHCLRHKQRCQEYEYICLYTAVEHVEVKTEYQRESHRYDELEKLHIGEGDTVRMYGFSFEYYKNVETMPDYDADEDDDFEDEDED